MDKGKEYIKNTIILFIGKFSTQFMSLLLIPIYTRYLITEDYGAIDLIQTYITLFVPILILRLDTSIFRFLIDERKNEENKTKIISSSFVMAIIQIMLFVILFMIVNGFVNIVYKEFVVINIIVLMISSLTLQICRGLGNTKKYSEASIITGCVTLILNILLIIKFRYNASGILISSIIANLICILFLTISSKIYKYINLKKINLNIIKQMMKYSIPMIPNSLSWWIVNASDRTIISTVLGVTYNGIYAISCKFSNIINSIFTIFNMSWQESASLYINDKDRDEFFNNMINNIFVFFSSLSISMIAILPLLYNIIVGKNYLSSYNYIPILIIANVFNILINLIGGIYVAKKLTNKIANTTIVSAIINLLFNIVFIKKIGLYAASISTLVAYSVMFVYRYFDVQKYVNLKFDFTKISKIIVITIVSTFFYYINNSFFNIINVIITFIYILLINKFEIKSIINLLRNKKIK